ncbi:MULTISPECIES: cysteine-rich CWC family protein [Pseudomonadati]|uniref:Cysteine-rich CWC family protein n=1 Tax=Shewanella aestuarii TaxID=1028752 RepID=A0ABT0L1R5_9GAMM|nr:cysteine-rich CWC family protein [Shewanella aestuarii]MCL1117410.1 cysteine-rich CWC family protein [Shewanella aestuarii]
MSKNHCPICQQNNQCTMVNGQDVANCWCMDTGFSAVDLIAQYLRQHPQMSLNKQQCLCRTCLDKIAASQLTSKSSVQIYIP